MPVKVKFGGKSHSTWWRIFRALLLIALVFAIIGSLVFAAYYHQYSGMVDERLAQGPLFESVAQVYAAPQEVRTGQALSAASIAAQLRKAGYNTNPQLGSFQLRGDSILIKPGPQSYLATDGATITTTGGVVQAVTAENGAALAGYKLEPQLMRPEATSSNAHLAVRR